METKKRKGRGIATALCATVALAAGLVGAVNAMAGENTCVDCHTSIDALTASASEGVDPAMYLVSEEYPATLHGSLGCTFCHGGDATAADAKTSMADIVAYPTADGGVAVCGTCHSDVTDVFVTSLHYTTAGIECALQERLSVASKEAGDDIASIAYRDASCRDCHADCGMCHVRSAQQEQFGTEYTGLIDNHMFIGESTNETVEVTCNYCHAGAIASCFVNDDVHGPSGAGMTCMDCHSTSDVHGDGNAYDTMIHSGAVSVECEDCHAESALESDVHTKSHLDNVDCWARHTAEYNVCYNCHGWGSLANGDAFVAENDIILGMDVEEDKITTLVKAPIGELMMQENGYTLQMDDLNTRSSWWIGFTHGVIVPEVNQDFCDRCHGEGSALLKEADLQFPDHETEQLVGELPAVDASALNG